MGHFFTEDGAFFRSKGQANFLAKMRAFELEPRLEPIPTTDQFVHFFSSHLPFIPAFCPYHIGHFTVVGCRLKPLVSGAHFEGMLVTLCGYCVIALSLVAVHAAVARLRLRKVARMLGELLPNRM